ncbi:MAG: NAD-dependent epimerase/dehydratase family protein [Steroidobacteraceae bacterium]
MNSSTRTALVLGITGGVGGEIARALLKRGWRVRALHRGAAASVANVPQGSIDWVRGDAMNASDVIAAASGVTAIVHGVNPPRYENWRQLAIPMLENTIAAARAARARILFPGTIYNFGMAAFPLLREDSSQRPTTRKGAIRVEMEQLLANAAADGVRTLIVRAGDFFGPNAGNSWLSQGLISAGKPVRRVWYPGRFDAGHAWAYLPDLAEIFCRLLERDAQLANFDVYHFRGHYFDRGVTLAEAVCDVAGIPRSRIHRFPWWATTIAAPFVKMLGEMQEVRYLWQETVELDNRKLLAALGEETHTPLHAALQSTLEGLGCLRVPAAKTNRHPPLSDSSRSARP